MSLYTGKGDDGTTKTFGCDQRISKSSAIAEALGALDEVNSFLGVVKVRSKEAGFKLGEISFEEIVHGLQENLFTVQAEVAGADKKIDGGKVIEMENWIALIEQELPPIKTFFISGGTELGASFDFARTLARRAERRVVAVADSEKETRLSAHSQASGNSRSTLFPSPNTLKFLNRLSSVLYALARLTNHKSGINESAPSYN